MDNTLKIDDDVRQLLRDASLVSPLLTYMLTRGYPLVPRAYTIELRWDSAASGQYLNGNAQQFTENLYNMFWVQDITYTIRRPDLNVGVFGARQQDEYAKRNPYIDVKIRTTGRDQYDITDGFQPLENIAKTVSERAYGKRLWVLNENANLIVEAVNTRAFEDNETPYIVLLTFSGLELSGCNLPTCGYDEVICKLRSDGLYPEPKG